MGFLSPKIPAVPVAAPVEVEELPPAAAPSTAADATVVKAGSSQRSRAGAAPSTVGDSGAGGLKKTPQTAGVTLLGG